MLQIFPKKQENKELGKQHTIWFTRNPAKRNFAARKWIGSSLKKELWPRAR